MPIGDNAHRVPFSLVGILQIMIGRPAIAKVRNAQCAGPKIDSAPSSAFPTRLHTQTAVGIHAGRVVRHESATQAATG